MSTETTNPRDQWLAERMTGIGGSDAAAAIGISPYKSQFQLWAEKTGLAPPDDLSDNEAVEWGIRLEAPILQAYGDKSGRAVWPWEQYKVCRHKTIPWMLDTPDAIQDDAQRGVGIVQIKTANQWLSGEWEDGPPLHYQVQILHEMAVMGLAWGTLVVLIGGQRLRWFDIERHERLIENMIEREREFWDLVESRIPPKPDGSQATRETLKKLYPIANGETTDLPREAVQWDRRLVRIKRRIKHLEELQTLYENQMKAAIGANEAGILCNGVAYTYRTQTRHYPAKEATIKTFRVLRRKGG